MNYLGFCGADGDWPLRTQSIAKLRSLKIQYFSGNAISRQEIVARKFWKIPSCDRYTISRAGIIKLPMVEKFKWSPTVLSKYLNKFHMCI